MELETFLQTEDRDRLVWLAESSLHVKNHPSFFLWSQGALQMAKPRLQKAVEANLAFPGIEEAKRILAAG
jgi:hypothetical protein